WRAVLPRLGGKANHTPFEILAQRIPFGLIQRYLKDVFSMEVLLFGGLGLLRGEAKDKSHQQYLSHWHYLRHKHQLGEMAPLPVKQSRMRPHAFPMLRLAQLAQWLTIIPQWTHLLTLEGMKSFLQYPIGVSTYWQAHHGWGLPHKLPHPQLGRQSKEGIICNALLPVALLYDQQYQLRESEELISFAHTLKAEQNKVTRKFKPYPIQQQNMMDTQGIYHLYHAYCKAKKCLSCEIGQTLLTTGLGNS
ncbi:MAG: DUF2851 family protein, partial [Bacteroidota bacterium]